MHPKIKEDLYKSIKCLGCNTVVKARLTTGYEVYTHRPDLHKLQLWKCDTCKNYVGTHSRNPHDTKPLGAIPTAAIRAARIQVHNILDPLWKSGRYTRTAVYTHLSRVLDKDFHTANIESIEEAEEVIRLLNEIPKGAL